MPGGLRGFSLGLRMVHVISRYSVIVNIIHKARALFPDCAHSRDAFSMIMPL